MHESIHELKTRKHVMAFPWAWRWKSGQLQNESSRKGTSASNLVPPHRSWQGESPPLAEVGDTGTWHITGHETQPCPTWGCSPRAHPCHPITQKCWGLQPTHVPGLLQSTGGLQLKPQSSTKTTLGQLHKRSLEGRFLCSDFECFPLLIHSGQALYEFTRQRLQPALSPCFHIFVRAPSCLQRQDRPKPHLKSEGLVHKHKAT